jgi:hypothetical protein
MSMIRGAVVALADERVVLLLVQVHLAGRALDDLRRVGDGDVVLLEARGAELGDVVGQTDGHGLVDRAADAWEGKR